MFNCCTGKSCFHEEAKYEPLRPNADTYKTRFLDHYKKERNFQITAFALAIISVLLFGIAFILFGLGTLPPTALFGLGIFPYLGGAFLSFVAIGTSIAALIALAVSGVQRYQKNHWENKLNSNN